MVNLQLPFNDNIYGHAYDDHRHGDAHGYASLLYACAQDHHGYETLPRVHAYLSYDNTSFSPPFFIEVYDEKMFISSTSFRFKKYQKSPH